VILYGAIDVPKADLFGGKSDPFVVVEAQGDCGSEEFQDPAGGDGHNMATPWTARFPVKNDTTHPEWYESGLLLYKRDTTAGFKLSCVDKDWAKLGDDLLEEQMYPLPKSHGSWEEHVLKFKSTGGTLRFKVMTTPCEEMIVTREQTEAYVMEEHILELKDGVKAILSYRVKEGNNNAVLWIPGRNSCFQHPHVGSALEDAGYDLYALSYRNIGECRKYCGEEGFVEGNDLSLTSHPGPASSFGIINEEEVKKSLEFISSKKKYQKLLGYGHGVGGTIWINHILEHGDEQVDALILNSPFLSWDQLGGQYDNDYLFENMSAALQGCGSNDPASAASPEHGRLMAWAVKCLSQYHFDAKTVGMNRIKLTFGFVSACKEVFEKLEKLKSRITTKPVFLIRSRTENCLTALKSNQDISPLLTDVLMPMGGHDIFRSYERSIVDSAIGHLTAWLKTSPTW